MNLISDGLFIPAVTIALLAWMVPKLFAMLLPEGVGPLLLNAFLSTLTLFGVSTAFFVLLYLGRGMGWSEIASFGIVANIAFFGKLGLLFGMIWAPFMVLSVANLPRYWVEKVW